MARFTFRLPDIGEGIAEAEIVAWHVKVGDRIEEDAGIADMMTDKATVEMESPVSGTVVEIAGKVGDMVAIGSALAVIEVAGEDEVEERLDAENPDAVTAIAIPSPPAGEGDSPPASGVRGVREPEAVTDDPSPRSASLSRPLPQGERGLLVAVSDTPALDVKILRDHARDGDEFESFIARRLNHEPVAYITGTRGFWTIDLDVGPAVLIPRSDSETLIDAAVAHFGEAGPKRVIDLGTGSGALLLAALDQWPDATGVGVDSSEAALEIATRNAGRIAPGRAEMRLGDWAIGIDEAFDLVLCNPPYVETGADLDPQVRDYEPVSALFAGQDGLDDFRIIVPQLERVTGGIACIEIGHTQAAAVTALLENEGFDVMCRKDLGGRDRCLVAKRK